MDFKFFQNNLFYDSDVGCLSSVTGLLYFKRDFVGFLQQKKAMILDAATVHKDIPIVFGFDKTIAFFLTIPFDSSFHHIQ